MDWKTQYAMKSAAMLDETGIAITERERRDIEIADFGLGEFEKTGLALVVYENNDRYCAKEIVMLPGQTCPEHRHPPRAGSPGKKETFRVRAGEVRLFVPGPESPGARERAPSAPDGGYTVFHEILLRPAEQYTLAPDTLHWFQAGAEGAIVSEFSSASDDASDIFTDARIRRVP